MRAMLVCLLAACGAAAGEKGLLAHYRFDEGEGEILHDASGHGNHGAIEGATWVTSGGLFALRFDGVDDHVDFGEYPGLCPTRAVSVEAWVHPLAVPAAGEPGVVGKRYASYGLTYYRGGRCWWYISGGPNHCSAAVGTGEWHHVVGTFDGKHLRLYVDGTLGAAAASKAPTVGTAGPFRMGNSTGEARYTKGAHFHGLLDEVRVYGRALSADEVRRHYRTTRLTGLLDVRTYVSVFSGKMTVELDPRGLGELPPGAVAHIELGPRARRTVPLPSWGKASVTLDLGQPPGRCELVVRAATKEGKPIGKPHSTDVAWPPRPRWEGAPDARPLNNLVAELANDSASAPRAFVHPRDGWVFLASTAQGAAAFPATVRLDGKPLHTHTAPGTLEAMRLLTKGRHTLTVEPLGGHVRLVARAVPELVFSKFGAHPHVHEYGKYDWAFLQKHVLPNLNVLVATGAADQERFLKQWRAQGRRVLVECGVPGLRAKEAVSADEAERYWSGHKGMTHPLLDGVLADEFFGGDSAKYAAWTEAARRIRANPKLKGRLFYPYCGAMHGAEPSRAFIRTVMDAGWKFAFERYLPEARTEPAARAYLDSVLGQTIAAWEKAMPGATGHMIACIGTFSQPPESLDINPATSHKVFLDMQLHLLANHPACFGLGGVMTYLCSYTDEETVRWMGTLFRHYCIEGRANRFTTDPYMLPHLRNGDFEDGLNGWTVTPAEPGRVAARSRPGFSWLQGRYPRTSQGDTVLCMKRSATRANVVTQPVKALDPKRLYTLRLYCGDFQDLAKKQEHALSVQLSNVEVLRDRSFRHVFANCYSHHHGPFDREHRAWMTYHWLLFRPKAREATLTLSDWAGAKQPGGPAGQELMLNFVQIQPYD